MQTTYTLPNATVTVTDLNGNAVATLHVQTYDRFNAMQFAIQVVAEMFVNMGYSAETAGALAELHVYETVVTTRTVTMC